MGGLATALAKFTAPQERIWLGRLLGVVSDGEINIDQDVAMNTSRTPGSGLRTKAFAITPMTTGNGSPMLLPDDFDLAGLLRRRCADEKAGVRKVALQALEV